MMTFETNVHIGRTVEDVFDYVSDPLRFAQWNSAVRAVRAVRPVPSREAAQYVMERELPGGRVENLIEVVANERPIEFAIRSISGPTPFVYRYRFASAAGGAEIAFSGAFELTGIAGLAGPLAKRAVKRGVDDNLATLKGLLEAQALSA